MFVIIIIFIIIIKGQALLTDTKLVIEAKLAKSVYNIKNDLAPSWSHIVAKEVESKFGDMSAELMLSLTLRSHVRKLLMSVTKKFAHITL